MIAGVPLLLPPVHYRKGLVFSWENLDNAKAAYDKLVARVAALSGEGTVGRGGRGAVQERLP